MSLQDYGAVYSISDQMAKSDVAEEYAKQHIEEMTKDALYKAVTQQREGEWMVIKSELGQYRNYDKQTTDFFVKIRCRPVENARVFIPVFEHNEMPKDVFECDHCGGYTKNDHRGNCMACGAPRHYKVSA
jgi:hypothetical protein